MADPATLYASTDASAPQMSSTLAGSMRDILKAVLIDGYGTRTPVGGWTAPYDDAPNNTIVLKHATESRFLRIDDNIEYRYAHALAFTAMTDVNTGTGQFPDAGELLAANYIVGKRYTTGVTRDIWFMLVADSGDWFYFFTQETNYPTGFYFGKLDYPDPIAARWILTGYKTTSMSQTLYPQTLYTGSRYAIDRDRYELGFQEVAAFDSLPRGYVQPSPIDGRITFSSRALYSTTAPSIHLGYLKNRYITNGTISGLFPNGFKLTLDGVNYLHQAQSGNSFLYEYTTDV